MTTTSTQLSQLSPFRTYDHQSQREALAEAKCGLDYDVVTGRHFPRVLGSSYAAAQTPDDYYGSPECFEVTIQIRGYCPLNFPYEDRADFVKFWTLPEKDRAILSAKCVFLEIAPIEELCDLEHFDVSGPHHFAYHCKGDKLFFSCTYEGYEIC